MLRSRVEVAYSALQDVRLVDGPTTRITVRPRGDVDRDVSGIGCDAAQLGLERDVRLTAGSDRRPGCSVALQGQGTGRTQSQVELAQVALERSPRDQRA